MKISIFFSKWNLSVQIFSKLCCLLINFWFIICYFLGENKRWLIEKQLWLCFKSICLMHQIVTGLLLSAWVEGGMWSLDSDDIRFRWGMENVSGSMQSNFPFHYSEREWVLTDPTWRSIWGFVCFPWTFKATCLAFALIIGYDLLLLIYFMAVDYVSCLLMKTCGVLTRKYFLQIHLTLLCRMSSTYNVFFNLKVSAGR